MLKRFLFFIIFSLQICTSCSNPCANPYKLRCQNIIKDKRCLYPDCEPGSCPLLLEEAVMIGLSNNWQVRFQKTQEKVQRELATSETLRMLPHPKVTGVLSHRSNLPLVFNTAPSSEKTTRTLQVEGLWNLLEFSMAFFNSRIAKMQVCLVKQQEIRTQHKLILEITESYMNCLAHYNLLEEVEQAKVLMNQRIEEIKEEIDKRLIPAGQGLEEINELQEKMLKTLVINTSFDTARQELLNRMGLAPDTPITLPKIDLEKVSLPHFDIGELEETALLLRPELAELDVQEKIAKEEVKLSFAKMIPGINLFVSQDWDKNKFLVNPDWATLGVRASYNLLSVPVNYFGAKAASSKTLVTKENRLFISAAVLSQVNISAEQSENFWEDYHLARAKYNNRKESLKRFEMRVSKGATKRSRLAYFFADYVLNKSIALKGLSSYFTELERLAVSVGVPLMFYEQIVKNQCLSNEIEEGGWTFE